MMSLSAAQMQEQLGPVVPVDDDDPSMAMALPIVKTYRSVSRLGYTLLRKKLNIFYLLQRFNF